MSCDACEAVCVEYATAVLGVLERDFVQLTHGKRANLVQGRTGVQFLLTGIVLGLLYESIPQTSKGDWCGGGRDTNADLLRELMAYMMDSGIWGDALRFYGAAPKRKRPQTQYNRLQVGLFGESREKADLPMSAAVGSVTAARAGGWCQQSMLPMLFAPNCSPYAWPCSSRLVCTLLFPVCQAVLAPNPSCFGFSWPAAVYSRVGF